MSFGGFNDSHNTAPMAEINVTPMVDVMLVLLVIFILAAPLFTHAIKLDLPSAQSAPSEEKPQSVTIARSGKMCAKKPLKAQSGDWLNISFTQRIVESAQILRPRAKLQVAVLTAYCCPRNSTLVV